MCVEVRKPGLSAVGKGTGLTAEAVTRDHCTAWTFLRQPWSSVSEAQKSGRQVGLRSTCHQVQETGRRRSRLESQRQAARPDTALRGAEHQARETLGKAEGVSNNAACWSSKSWRWRSSADGQESHLENDWKQ